MKAFNQSAPSPNRPGRAWRVPPALYDDPGDVLEGAGVLRDFGGAPLSLVLWQAAREVMLWSRAGERAGLFAPSAHRHRLAVLRKSDVPEEVAPFLRALSEAVLMEPELAESEYVSRVCRRVSDWAMDAGAGETALWYAQAAAVALPSHAPTALMTGRIALRLGKLERAESWLLRTVAVARNRDWNAYAQAFLALARVSEQRIDRARARQRLIRAVRVGRRAGLSDVRGQALHALMRLALDDGELGDAARYAHGARRNIGRDHSDRVSFSTDFVELLARSGETERALALLQTLLSTVAEPSQRMYLLALRAVAHARQENRSGALADVWTAAWSLASENEGAALRVRTLLTLAAAARKAGNTAGAQRAEDLARTSVRTRTDGWLVERHARGSGW